MSKDATHEAYSAAVKDGWKQTSIADATGVPITSLRQFLQSSSLGKAYKAKLNVWLADKGYLVADAGTELNRARVSGKADMVVQPPLRPDVAEALREALNMAQAPRLAPRTAAEVIAAKLDALSGMLRSPDFTDEEKADEFATFIERSHQNIQIYRTRIKQGKHGEVENGV